MSSTFKFQVTVQVEVTVDRLEGKFASRDEIAESLRSEFLAAADEAISSAAHDAALDGLGADGESVYEVSDVSILGADAFEYDAERIPWPRPRPTA